jgi:hypothetical protein
MKKIILSMLLVLRLTADVFATEEKIKPEILQAFNSRFSGAMDVTWMTGADYCKATFNYYGSRMVAYYTVSGKLKGVTRNINSTDLPLYLRNTLQKKYQDYWISNLVEESNQRGFCYYITLENADQKIVLRSAYGNNWEVYHLQNKG